MRTLVLALLAIGCSKSAGDANKLDPALEAKGVEGLRKLADAYATAGTCEQLAAALEQFAAEYNPTFQAIKDAVNSGAKGWDGQHPEELADLRAKAQPALKRCAADRAVISASQKLRLE
jgi:hypothetical protein